MNNSDFITGWDIGGAHLKAARADNNGHIIDVIQEPCPLWLGLSHLKEAVKRIHTRLNNQQDAAAITMTGELVDLFSHRQQGVEQIIDCMTEQLETEHIKIYSPSAWLSTQEAKQQWQQVASMNWHASAQLAATTVENGLFIDIGSTTCDIIPIKNHQACAQGQTDFDRQITRELLYTGTIRTPLIALAQQAPFKEKSVGLAAELFATTGDCWVLTNKLAPETIQDTSSDGQPWTESHCQQRLARLLGTDTDIADKQEWQKLATWFNQQQIKHIENACIQVISSASLKAQPLTFIGAGVGRFMVKKVAENLNANYHELHQTLDSKITQISDHAPAAAIALLAAR